MRTGSVTEEAEFMVTVSSVGQLSSAAESLVVTDGQRPWICDLEPYSSNGRN